MSSAFPLVTVIVAGIVYHLVQKGSGAAPSPWPMLAVAYGAAFALAAVLALAALVFGLAYGVAALVRELPMTLAR